MSINPDDNSHYTRKSSNYAYTMQAVAEVAVWVESHLKLTDKPPTERIVNLEELFEGKLPQPAAMPRLKRESSSSIALQRLISVFDLSDTEVLVLLTALATEIIPGFERMCGAYHQSMERTTPTLGMLASLFSTNKNSRDSFDWQAVNSLSNLRRWKLIRVGEFKNLPFNQRPVTIDPAILDYLVGSNYHDPQIEEIVEVVLTDGADSSSYDSDALSDDIDEIIVSCKRAVAEQYPILFQLTGTDVTNKDRFASTVASSVGCSLIAIDYSDITSNSEQLTRLATRLRRWHRIDGSLPYIKADELRKDDHRLTNALRKLISKARIPLFLSTIEPMGLGQVNTIDTEVGAPDKTIQMSLWRRYLDCLPNSELDRKLSILVSQFNLSAPAIKTIALRQDLGSSTSDSAFEQLWSNCRLAARQKLDSLATRVSSDASWHNLILSDSVKDSLSDILAQVGLKHLVYGTWDMDSNRGLGITALFSGVSGTGKTTAAEVIANELKLDLYKIDLSNVISKYIGETEKNLKKIFDAAEAGGAILLFDEADALFGKRTEVKDSKDRHSNAEISYLLQRMESYSGLAILTTNLPDAIDSAFKRRLRFVVEFAYPDAVAQERIWRSAFGSAAPTEGLDYRSLAELNLTGGNIRSVALNAAFKAARAGEAIGMKHIVSAALAEAKKLGNATHKLEKMKSRLNSELPSEGTASAFAPLNLDPIGKGDENQGNAHSNKGVGHDIKGDRLWQEPSFKSEKSTDQTSTTRLGMRRKPPHPSRSNRQNAINPEPTKSSDNPTQIPTNRTPRDPFSQPRNHHSATSRDYSKMSPQEILDSTAPYLRNNDRSSACSILRNALAYYPNDSGLNFWLGKINCEGKLNYTEALAVLERAEAGDGQWLNNPEGEKAGWYWQAVVISEMPGGNMQRVCALCQKYQKALPNGIYARLAKQKYDEANMALLYDQIGGKSKPSEREEI